RTVDASEAARIGLASRVAEDPVAEALDVAETMCRWSPFGIWMTKEVIWSNLEAASLLAAIDLENRSQVLAGHTGNLNEARAAFRQRRPPRYERD
ncbi:MAG TPA: enoyl-CoA hydratase/isomerase family protein, partial [Acidimicrobiales bacterium]|nr:enoyl-CoA hydratase/isomerase family protein [Acidimicrobiales bacterium]